jgi:dimethylargininase
MLIALTREISPNLSCCELTHLKPEAIDIALAREQHRSYEEALTSVGCAIHRLPPTPELPDSVFVEDTCHVLDELAIITRPGALSRRPETASVAQALQNLRKVCQIVEPGTLDGGDILRLGQDLFVGLSRRSNEAGIEQLREVVAPHGYKVTPVTITGCLHLKSAVTQVAEMTILINRHWVNANIFVDMQTIDVDPSEPFAANALLVNKTVIHASAFPRTRERLEKRGIRVLSLDMSELAKAEGGVTCCSVILNQL